MGLSPIIVNTGEPEKKEQPCKELKDIGFYETALLKNVIFPFMDDLPDRSIKQTHFKSLKQISKAYKIEYFETGDFNQPYFAEFLRKRSDIIGGISFRILTIFRKDLLSLFEDKGWFLWNLHTGILPEYRGVHIPFRAMNNKEEYYGWTLHEIDQGIDTGNIIALTKKPIDYTETVFDLYTHHVSEGIKIITKSLERFLLNGKVPSIPQDILKQKYYSFPTQDNFKEYEDKNIRFLPDVKFIIDFYLECFAPSKCVWRNDLRKILVKFIQVHENIEEDIFVGNNDLQLKRPKAA